MTRRAPILLGVLAIVACAAAVRAPAVLAQALTKVLLLSPPEAELTRRILGQTQDLSAELAVEAPPAGLRSEDAAALAKARKARIVVWTEGTEQTGLVVHLLDASSGELRSRQVASPEHETLASSTTAEMAALMVRSELSAWLEEQREAVAAPPPPPPEKKAPRAPPPSPSVSEEPPAPEAPQPWSLALGYRPSRPFAHHLLHGAALGLRRQIGGFALGATAVGTFPLEIAHGGTRISLTRLQLRLEALKSFNFGARWQLLLGVAASLSVDLRKTLEAPAPLEPTGRASTLSGGFGLLAELRVLLAKRVGALLAIGADGVPFRTQFVVADTMGNERLARLSWLDPWLMVGVFTQF